MRETRMEMIKSNRVLCLSNDVEEKLYFYPVSFFLTRSILLL